MKNIVHTHIIIDADLTLTPAELAAAWNAGSQGATRARVTVEPAFTYDAGLLEIVVVTIGAAGANLVAAGIQQIVNSLVEQRSELPPAEVVELKRPDGSPLIIVRRKNPPR